MTGGIKHDQEKPDITLVSPYFTEGIAQVMNYGAKKYERNNWRKGLKYTRLLAAVLRHVLAIVRGEDLDPETGLPHTHHAACGLMMIAEFQKDNRQDLDDRDYKMQDVPFISSNSGNIDARSAIYSNGTIQYVPTPHSGTLYARTGKIVDDDKSKPSQFSDYTKQEKKS